MSSYGLWLSAAGMKIQEHRQTVLASNIANVNTTGFKEDLAIVTQRSIASRSEPRRTANRVYGTGGRLDFAHPVLDGLAGGLNVRSPHHNLAQGAIERTDKPLDVAIAGEGFLAVSDGEVTRYTRDGQLAVGPSGELVLAAGEGRWKVLDPQLQPVTLDPAGAPPFISTDGGVYQGREVVARLGLFTTNDRPRLAKIGENLFSADGVSMAPVEGRFVSGAREQSNVDVVEALARLIEVSRAYELNANLLQLQDQTASLAVNTVGRLP